MDYQEILFREYQTYVESKDRFVERSFMINRFYLVIVFALMIWLFYQHDRLHDTVTMTYIINAALGMAASTLWFLNQDSYAYLIKIRLASVIEKFEQQLPLQPHAMEYEEIKRRNQKKRVMFVDIQKGLALMSFFIFFAMFTYSAGLKVVELISNQLMS